MTKKVVNVEAQTIAFVFDDNTSETFELSKVPSAIHVNLTLHGASQKVGDSYAGAAKSADPLAYAKQAVAETIAQLYAGDWRAATASGPRVTDLAQALAMATGESLEDAIEAVEESTDEQKKVWRAHAQIKAALATISANRATERLAAAQKAAADAPKLTL